MQKIGFLGLGIMGAAMAKNLIRAGFEVTVWNRSPGKCYEMTALGAKQGATPKDVMKLCDVTFTMVSDPAAAEAVCFGPEGVLEGIEAGKGYIDMSTVDAVTAQKIGRAITEAGGRFLEAPVSGSKKPAEDGTLIILAAGDRPLYDEALPAFEKMGKKILYLGSIGQGANMKLVVNMMMGGMMAIFCEGLDLGRKAGLEASDILDVIDAGAMANPMFRLKGDLICKETFTAAFPLKHMQKDLRLALLLGDRLNRPLYTAASANEGFKRAKAAGLADEDFSAIYKIIANA